LYLQKTFKALWCFLVARSPPPPRNGGHDGGDGAKPLIEEYAKHMKEEDLPGDETVKFIQDYLKLYKK